ncbi:hypothetical protein NQ318_016143 [Aromia moschata]|uniref:Uncharacterized protein n=1 Tax=Aromia moschata TaxID=1265417 RepID=A0AAV8Y0K7_9CUCU|nr:hypothetical protein NQ318_016143 [Aromia moschata]
MIADATTDPVGSDREESDSEEEDDNSPTLTVSAGLQNVDEFRKVLIYINRIDNFLSTHATKNLKVPLTGFSLVSDPRSTLTYSGLWREVEAQLTLIFSKWRILHRISRNMNFSLGVTNSSFLGMVSKQTGKMEETSKVTALTRRLENALSGNHISTAYTDRTPLLRLRSFQITRL